MATPMNSTIFLVADEEEPSRLTGEHLSAEGFRVEMFEPGPWLSSQLQKVTPDLVIFDLLSPSLEGLALCKDIKTIFRGPLMILSGRGDDVLQVLGLEWGADDFLIKPVSSSVLLARVRALLRRVRSEVQSVERLDLSESLSIDLARREVFRDGTSIGLTTREFDLLLVLAQNAGKILSRDDLYHALFNTDYNGYDRSIDIYISRLRQKLGEDPIFPRFLKTVRGSGYLLTSYAS